jgi:uncharacterized protein (TIGR03437 family)
LARHAAAALGAAADYTVYLGAAEDYRPVQVIADGSGNTYVAGDRWFPAVPATPSQGFVTDVFLAKLDAAGNVLFLATLSGKSSDHAAGVALDAAGNIYLAGRTLSPNFPLRNALEAQPAPRGSGFLVKLSPDGSRLIYSTYFGGVAGPTSISALAVDADGNAYVTGNTSARDFPTTAGLPAASVSTGLAAVSGAFISKISAAGDKVLYSGVITGNALACTGGSSCFLSARYTAGTGIGLDAAGNAYMAGNTNTLDLPTTAGAFLTRGIGAFAAKVNAAGTALAYVTYLSAAEKGLSPMFSATTFSSGIAVDTAGNAYLAGTTSDPEFPVTAGAPQTILAGQTEPPNTVDPTADAFAVKLSPDGDGILWGTYLGGSRNDAAAAIALDGSGKIWLAGTTDSPEFPNANGWSAGADFLVELDASASSLGYSARYPDGTVSQSLALDTTGLVHMAGTNGLVSTLLPGEPASRRIFGIMNAAGGPIGGRIAPGELLTIFGPGLGPQTPQSFTLDASGFVPRSLAGVQVLVGGTPAPVLYVSAGQIEVVTPFGVAGKDTVNVQVLLNGAATPDFSSPVVPTFPGIFRLDGKHAAAINEDGTVNSADHPAKAGSVVALWVTGVANNYLPPPADGQVQTAAQDEFCCQAQIYGQPASVLYGGTAPGMVAGVWQVNVRLPESASVEVTITLAAGGRTDAAPIYVTE